MEYYIMYVSACGPIWISNVRCNGNETHFSQCDYTSINRNYNQQRYGNVNTQCSSNELAGVLCIKPAINRNHFDMVYQYFDYKFNGINKTENTYIKYLV